jgi:CRP-like cAMP-binding protein
MVSGQEGTVVQMNWRTLTLHTRDNHNLIVPNSHIAKQEIVNYSRPTPLQKIHVAIGVAYRHSPGLVKETITGAVAAIDSVARTPPPEVLIKSFGESALIYDVRFWITDYEHLPQISDAVLARIWYSLKRAGLEIPYPATDVYLHSLSEDHEARAQERLRREVFAELRSLAVFKPLNEAQVEQLAQSARLQRFGPGEVLVRQGDQGDSLYTIKSGRVRVEARAANGSTNVLASLSVGDFFGEMSLLTGEPRSASVIAEGETEVVVVAKSDFATVLQADMSIVEALSTALEERMRNAQSATATDPALNPIPALSQRPALISRIRGFFGIKSA